MSRVVLLDKEFITFQMIIQNIYNEVKKLTISGGYILHL